MTGDGAASVIFTNWIIQLHIGVNIKLNDSFCKDKRTKMWSLFGKSEENKVNRDTSK